MIQRFNAPGRPPTTVDWGPGRAARARVMVIGGEPLVDVRPPRPQRLPGQGKDTSRERQRRWRQSHLEEERKRKRDYYVKNRERINAKRRERRAAYAENQRRYYAAHREEINARERARRAAKRATA